MKLQVAMDVLTTEAALTLAGQVAEYVDIIELGTPLIKHEGLSAVRAIKDAHPDKMVFADLKTMDAGELEADIAFSAGADYVTVLGTAGDSTIIGAVKAAKAHKKGIVVDLIGVTDKVTRAKEVTALGAVFVEMHAGLDEQAEPGFTFETLLNDGETAKVPFSVAGGINASTIAAVQRAGATVAVAGSSIYSAADPAAAAAALKAAIL
ncbi:3-hexulose-6-phosphate synthase [Salinibacterium sp. NSLL150]|uniref:3-hexulose-6-phosphate synthase n=1 Tax=unclassified Salinibacterium TaxID=2632331 RepID=UPI0018CE370B|nr:MULTISPECIES: 3-hexulose-6-phosphate synthase [unclassified Salinibacterium]MBH0099796.1 3-hexulose-6-phosphate synthase [Salinibacterium sp. NSLL35]MBH0102550.1 3-hexulose-6-phosphate synthase [Salinibacterium sp. NSLL150]MBH0105310.1 3-hexulose-6-phosphate synthase [Salinibacterium sp. NSLL16]MBH0108070.1 3-hexulose-6-phosphate synthase [Salinibacterium sp. NSLL17]